MNVFVDFLLQKALMPINFTVQCYHGKYDLEVWLGPKEPRTTHGKPRSYSSPIW
jgi:hypothetical protein